MYSITSQGKNDINTSAAIFNSGLIKTRLTIDWCSVCEYWKHTDDDFPRYDTENFHGNPLCGKEHWTCLHEQKALARD